MNRIDTLRRRALLRAVLLLVCAAAAISTASAQTGPLRIANNTDCAVFVCWNSGATCTTLAAHSTITVRHGCSATASIASCGGTISLGPGHSFVSNVDVGGCCADVAFSPGFVGCTFFMSIDPAAGPCPCRQ